jgi:hypothetical protein
MVSHCGGSGGFIINLQIGNNFVVNQPATILNGGK